MLFRLSDLLPGVLVPLRPVRGNVRQSLRRRMLRSMLRILLSLLCALLLLGSVHAKGDPQEVQHPRRTLQRFLRVLLVHVLGHLPGSGGDQEEGSCQLPRPTTHDPTSAAGDVIDGLRSVILVVSFLGNGM